MFWSSALLLVLFVTPANSIKCTVRFDGMLDGVKQVIGSAEPLECSKTSVYRPKVVEQIPELDKDSFFKAPFTCAKIEKDGKILRTCLSKKICEEGKTNNKYGADMSCCDTDNCFAPEEGAAKSGQEATTASHIADVRFFAGGVATFLAAALHK